MMKYDFRNLPKIRFTDFDFRNIHHYVDKIKNYILELIRIERDPLKISLSIAIGIFVGLAIPMGVQTFFIIPFIILFRANFILAYMATYISNPITILPIYYSALRIGEFIIRDFLGIKIIINFNKVQQLLNYFTFDKLILLGKEFLITFTIGLIIQGIIVTILIFFVSYTIISFLIKNKILIQKTNEGK